MNGTTYQGKDFHRYDARRRDQWTRHFARTFANDKIKGNSPSASITVFYDPRQPRDSQISRPYFGSITPAVLVNLGSCILALSLWGLYFRRFVFGTAWIAVTLIIATVLGGAPIYSAVEWARTAHSDGAGFAVLGAMMVGILMFFVKQVWSASKWEPDKVDQPHQVRRFGARRSA